MVSTLVTAQNQSSKKRIQITVMIVLLSVGALADMPSLEAAVGFNVNTYVTFNPLTSTYHTTDPNGCPPQFVGKFTFTALLGNKPASSVISDLVIRASTLTNGNILLAPQTNATLGGAGADINVPEVGQYADGLLSPGESVDVPFVLCLRSFQPFQFFVDVFGGITELVSINAAGANSGNLGSNLPSFSPNGRFIVFNS